MSEVDIICNGNQLALICLRNKQRETKQHERTSLARGEGVEPPVAAAVLYPPYSTQHYHLIGNCNFDYL